MSILVKFLSNAVLNVSIMIKIFLALGYCIDACRESRLIILDDFPFDPLVKQNLESNDQELHSSVQYLLQVCLDKPVKNRKEMAVQCMY